MGSGSVDHSRMLPCTVIDKGEMRASSWVEVVTSGPFMDMRKSGMSELRMRRGEHEAWGTQVSMKGGVQSTMRVATRELSQCRALRKWLQSPPPPADPQPELHRLARGRLVLLARRNLQRISRSDRRYSIIMRSASHLELGLRAKMSF